MTKKQKSNLENLKASDECFEDPTAGLYNVIKDLLYKIEDMNESLGQLQLYYDQQNNKPIYNGMKEYYNNKLFVIEIKNIFSL